MKKFRTYVQRKDLVQYALPCAASLAGLGARQVGDVLSDHPMRPRKWRPRANKRELLSLLYESGSHEVLFPVAWVIPCTTGFMFRLRAP